MPIDININVTLKADASLVNLMAYGCAWAADVYSVLHPNAKAPYTQEAVTESLAANASAVEEPAEKSPVAASEGVPKVDAGTSTPKAKTDAPAANPAPAAKAEAKTEAPSVFGEPDKVVSGDGLMQLRAAVLKFGTDDSTGENRKKLRAWLDARGFEKVTDVTNGKAPELIAYIEQELAKGDEGKEAAAHA